MQLTGTIELDLEHVVPETDRAKWLEQYGPFTKPKQTFAVTLDSEPAEKAGFHFDVTGRLTDLVPPQSLQESQQQQYVRFVHEDIRKQLEAPSNRDMETVGNRRVLDWSSIAEQVIALHEEAEQLEEEKRQQKSRDLAEWLRTSTADDIHPPRCKSFPEARELTKKADELVAERKARKKAEAAERKENKRRKCLAWLETVDASNIKEKMEAGYSCQQELKALVAGRAQKKVQERCPHCDVLNAPRELGTCEDIDSPSDQIFEDWRNLQQVTEFSCQIVWGTLEDASDGYITIGADEKCEALVIHVACPWDAPDKSYITLEVISGDYRWKTDE